mmetsp:Transcript_16382/g.37409  ORF Transcript_16382/g.37409 Transcript_16382/m.37409 type:complete len:217 (+) Transcript_16382:628-1278(+)
MESLTMSRGNLKLMPSSSDMLTRSIRTCRMEDETSSSFTCLRNTSEPWSSSPSMSLVRVMVSKRAAFTMFFSFFRRRKKINPLGPTICHVSLLACTSVLQRWVTRDRLDVMLRSLSFLNSDTLMEMAILINPAAQITSFERSSSMAAMSLILTIVRLKISSTNGRPFSSMLAASLQASSECRWQKGYPCLPELLCCFLSSCSCSCSCSCPSLFSLV